MNAARPFALFLALLTSALPLSAHDHWIAPTSFHPALGERVDLRLCVGYPSQFEEQIRDPRRIVRFDDIGLSAKGPAGRAIPGIDGKSPAGIFRSKEEGLHCLVFQSNDSFVEIAPEKYALYLKEEGLDDVLLESENRGG